MNDEAATDGNEQPDEQERLGDKTTLRCVICNKPFRGVRHNKPLGDPNMWHDTSIGVCPQCREKHRDILAGERPPHI
jgi:hypothetical protein